MEELWDVYDKSRNKIGTIKRGEKLNDDEFHLVVNVWIKTADDKFLVTKRCKNKSFAHLFECTGGSALATENSLDAAIREAKEETGIDIASFKHELVGSTLRYYRGCPDILDVLIFYAPLSKDIKVSIQEEEVEDFAFLSAKEILDLYKNNKFAANAFFYDALNK